MSMIINPYRFAGEEKIYWRVYVNAVNGGSLASLAEVQFRDSVGGADLTAPADAATKAFASSITQSGFEAENAFDDNDSTSWASDTNADEWVGWQFAESKDVVEVALTAETSINLDTIPKDFEIQYSPDGTTYTTALTVTGETGWSGGETRVFTL